MRSRLSTYTSVLGPEVRRLSLESEHRFPLIGWLTSSGSVPSRKGQFRDLRALARESNESSLRDTFLQAEI